MEATGRPSPDAQARYAGNDDALVAALADGDNGAYEFIVREYGGRLMRVIQRFGFNYDDACDVLQDAFLQAFRKIDQFEQRAKLSTWLHRIAVNAALMRRRSEKRRHERSIEDLLPRFRDDGHRIDIGPTWELTAEDILENEELRTQVRRYVDELPNDYRTVLILRDLEELDTQDTADVLGITPGAVKTRLHRARQALRTLLEQHMVVGEKS